MKQSAPKSSAFTVIELLVIIAVIAVLVALQLPALANTQGKVQRVYCSSNLKQVGIAFRTWAARNNDRLPMQVTRVNGGALEAVGGARQESWTSPTFPPIAQQDGVWMMFIVMSNELVTPKVLFCPSEGAQSHGGVSAIGPQATVFGPQLFAPGAGIGFQNDLNVSYFVGVDANTTRPDMLLSGDHNLATGANQTTKVGSFISAGTNSVWPVTAIGWQDNNHSKQGNVTFADGSVQNLTTAQFRAALNKTGDTARSAGNFVVAPGSAANSMGFNRLQFP